MVVWTILDHFGPARFPTVLRPFPIYQARKKSTNPNFWVRIFSGGVRVFYMKGWGPKSSVCPWRPGNSNFFAGISREFCWDVPELPEKFDNKKSLCSFFGPYFTAIWLILCFSLCKIWRFQACNSGIRFGGHKWTKMDLSRSKWTKMDRLGPFWMLQSDQNEHLGRSGPFGPVQQYRSHSLLRRCMCTKFPDFRNWRWKYRWKSLGEISPLDPLDPQAPKQLKWLKGDSKWLSGLDRKVTQKWFQTDEHDPKVTQKWLFESLSSLFPVNPKMSLLSDFWVTFESL